MQRKVKVLGVLFCFLFFASMLMITGPTQHAQADYNDTIYPSEFIEAWSYWEDGENSSKIVDWHAHSVRSATPPTSYTLTSMYSAQEMILNDGNSYDIVYEQTSTDNSVYIYFEFIFEVPYTPDKIYYDIDTANGGNGAEKIYLYINEDGVDTDKDHDAASNPISGNFDITSAMIQNGKIYGCVRASTSGGGSGFTALSMVLDQLCLTFDDTNNDYDYRSITEGMTEDAIDGTFKQEGSFSEVKSSDSGYFELRRYRGMYSELKDEDVDFVRIKVDLVMKAGVKGTISLEGHVESEEYAWSEQTNTYSYDKENLDGNGNLNIRIFGSIDQTADYNGTHYSNYYYFVVKVWNHHYGIYQTLAADSTTYYSTDPVDEWVCLKVDQLKATVTQWTDEVTVKFHDPQGIGLLDEVARIYVDGERQDNTFFMPNTSFNLTITDYFGNTLYQDTTESTADFIDVELPLYEVYFYNDDDSTDMVLWLSDTGTDDDIDMRIPVAQNSGIQLRLYAQSYYYKVVTIDENETQAVIVDWEDFTVYDTNNKPISWGSDKDWKGGGGGFGAITDKAPPWEEIMIFLLGILVVYAFVVHPARKKEKKVERPPESRVIRNRNNKK